MGYQISGQYPEQRLLYNDPAIISEKLTYSKGMTLSKNERSGLYQYLRLLSPYSISE